jgi:hypothetical protein
MVNVSPGAPYCKCNVAEFVSTSPWMIKRQPDLCEGLDTRVREKERRRVVMDVWGIRRLENEK